MDGTLRVSIRVRKYLWDEFVHDVAYFLYATIIISNALSKRYLHRSLQQLIDGIWAIPNFLAGVILLILAGAAGMVVMASMFAIPVILYLASTGRLQ